MMEVFTSQSLDTYIEIEWIIEAVLWYFFPIF